MKNPGAAERGVVRSTRRASNRHSNPEAMTQRRALTGTVIRA